jgi:hypothetical protein
VKTKHIIESTQDYSLFNDHEFQQAMSPAHMKRIMASMQKYGFLPSKPIQVYKKGGKYYIIDGHHRFYSAKSLGIPVMFVVEPESLSEAIGDENYAVRKWSNESFAKLYEGKGNPHYSCLLKYVRQGIGLNRAASMLRGESAHSGNAGRLVRDGSFTIKTTEKCDLIIETFRQLVELIPEIRKSSYVEAISVLLSVEEFDIETFWKRALANPKAFVKCASRDQALELIEEVYNFRAREKVNLRFMARESMRMRNLAENPNFHRRKN